jgi:hypothetical protein
MTTAAIEIPDELIKALEAELRDHAKGFFCRANEERDFCVTEGQLKDTVGFGNLWKEKDYAWRVLLNPSFQAEVILAVGNRDGHEVAEEQLSQIGPILDALSEAMPDDAVMDLMTEGDGAAEALSNSLCGYFLRAGSTSRMTRTAGKHAFSAA